VTHRKEWFSALKFFEVPIKVHIGNKSTMDALGKGIIHFEALVNGCWKPCYMENVLYVPQARRNLFSVISAVDKGMSFTSNSEECKFIRDDVVKARGARSGHLFKIIIRIVNPELSVFSEANTASSKDTLQIWHERLGHQNKRHVRKLLRDYKIDFVDEDSFCGASVEGKQHSNTFLERKQRALEPGAADLCGPMECASLSGAKYFLCITCDFSRYRMVYFLKEKSETSSKIEEVLKLVENHCGRQMKIFQCEFDNSTMQKLMSLNGVKLVVTNPYTPQQNGCAERSNRTITKMAPTLLLAKNLPKFL
jgi:hypothetical protein